MLNLVDETLHQMALFIEMLVILSLLDAVFARRNHGNRFMLKNEGNHSSAIIATVGDHMVADAPRQQSLGLGHVMPLTSGKQKAQRIAQTVDRHVNFGTESAATASQRLRFLSTVFLGAPAAQGWARTTVLSGITFSMSASSLKYSNRSSKTL